MFLQTKNPSLSFIEDELGFFGVVCSMRVAQILCKHPIGENRAKFQRERRGAVPFGVILAAKAPYVKVLAAQSGIWSAKYTASWAWITLQSCRRPVHFLELAP